MDALLQAIGGVLVILVCADVFFTVLFPASGRGPIRRPLERIVWGVFRLLGSVLREERRGHLVSYSGPMVMAATFWAWIFVLVTGWAMIYKPALGTAITASSGITDTGWATAFYFSGFNVTTLGVGDLTAQTGFYRLLVVLEAAGGFAFFSLVITYFLSVYPTLTSRNAFAQGLHDLTGRTGDAVELLVRFADEPDLPRLREHMASKAAFLRQMYQTHRFFPILRYFHYRDVHYELPRILLIALDTATLVRTALEPERHGRALRPQVLDELQAAAMSLLDELTSGDDGGAPSAPEAERWQARYAAARARLAEAGFAVRRDASAGARDYVARRAHWDRLARELAARMLHDWAVVEPPPESVEKQGVKC